MISIIATLLSIVLIKILFVFTIRRIIFTVTILATREESIWGNIAEEHNLLYLLILLACRDEARMIERLAESLRQLEYTQGKLHVVMIDGGSADEEQIEQTTDWHD